MKFDITRNVSLPFQQAIEKVTEELKKEGFGVLTTIDVKDTLKKKLDVDFQNYVILGACNPPFAYQTLTADKNIGLMLPCNVVVYESGNATVVSAFDPLAMVNMVENPVVDAVAEEVHNRLERVIASV